MNNFTELLIWAMLVGWICFLVYRVQYLAGRVDVISAKLLELYDGVHVLGQVVRHHETSDPYR